uniref:Uncharacterized protein n=1 Tax=Romanomermis culicivorax TaxID=13658 RepID=A0A915I8T7_ROMCU
MIKNDEQSSVGSSQNEFFPLKRENDSKYMIQKMNCKNPTHKDCARHFLLEKSVSIVLLWNEFNKESALN